MQSRRQEQLLSILTEREEWLTSRQLAGLLGVSDRTIRSDVDAINKSMDPPPIESNVRQGYRVKRNAKGEPGQPQTCPRKGLEGWDPPHPARETRGRDGEIPQTPDARCMYMIQRLLFDSRALNLTVLQSQIYVSGYSIDNDIKRMRKMLEPYANLKLVRRRECLSLEGDEASKRRFYRDLLMAEVQENFLNLNNMANMYHSFDLIEVKDIFVDVVKEYDYSLNESLFPMLIFHAGISVERMSHANYLEMEEKFQGLEDTIEYQMSKTFFERISKRLHIQVREGEIGMFALVIMGRRASVYTSDYVNFNGKWLNTRKLVMEVLGRLNELFGVDYQQDEDLIAGLKMHLHGLIERSRQQVNLENVFLDEIKQKYPMVFEMGVCILEYLEKMMGVRISDMEGGFIALHLGAASERMNSARRYRAVMILPYNQSFSEQCVKKISDMFRERMDVIKTYCLFEEEAVAALEPDLILSAFPLEHKLDVRMVPVNLFVDTDTEARILSALNQLDKQSFRLEFTSHISSLIRKEHYYRNLDCKTSEEVIHALCAGLQKEGIVEAGFEEVVLKREQLSPTSFVNTFAIPHAFGAYASNSTIAVAQLAGPVRWGALEVRLVMLFAINEGDSRMIKMFFDWVSDIVNQPKQLARLAESCSYEEFMDRLLE